MNSIIPSGFIFNLNFINSTWNLLLTSILVFILFIYKTIGLPAYDFLINPMSYPSGTFNIWKDFYIVKNFSYSEKIEYINKIIESLNNTCSKALEYDVKVVIPLEVKDKIAYECKTLSSILVEVKKVYTSYKEEFLKEHYWHIICD